MKSSIVCWRIDSMSQIDVLQSISISLCVYFNPNFNWFHIHFIQHTYTQRDAHTLTPWVDSCPCSFNEIIDAFCVYIYFHCLMLLHCSCSFDTIFVSGRLVNEIDVLGVRVHLILRFFLHRFRFSFVSSSESLLSASFFATICECHELMWKLLDRNTSEKSVI